MDQQRLVAARKVVQRSNRASEGGAQSVDRAATMLLLVGRAGTAGARLADLVAQSDLTKPTVHRILLALVRAGLLDQDATTRAYHLGPELYALGALASPRFGIHGASIRSLVRMSAHSGDSAFLSVPRDVYSICLHREDGPYPIRVQALAAGDRHPLGVGAGSLAMLAAMSDTEVEAAIAANIADGSLQPHPHYTVARLTELVRETRANGYALNPGLMLAGSWAIGVAVRGPDKRPIGALSIAAIEHRMSAGRQRELVPLLKAEAREVESRLGKTKVGALPRTKPPGVK